MNSRSKVVAQINFFGGEDNRFTTQVKPIQMSQSKFMTAFEFSPGNQFIRFPNKDSFVNEAADFLLIVTHATSFFFCASIIRQVMLFV